MLSTQTSLQSRTADHSLTGLTGATCRLQVSPGDHYLILSLSPGFSTMLGTSMHEGGSLLPLLSGGMPVDSFNLLKATLAECTQDSLPHQVEFRFTAANQGRHWFRANLLSTRDGDDLFIDLQLFDVSHQGAPDHARCHRDCRVAQLVEAMADGYWDFDLVSGRINVSDSFLAMLGYTRSDITDNYNWWRELIHPEDREATDHEIERRISGRADHFDLTYRIRTNSGKYLWVLSRAKVSSRDQEGRAVHLIGTQIDLTEQKLLEQGARDSELAYRTIFDESPFSVLLSRVSGELVDVNERYLQRTGKRREEVIGKNLLELEVIDEPQYRMLSQAIAEGRSLDGVIFQTHTVISPEPREVAFTTKNIQVYGESMVLTITNDITDLKRAEAELRGREAQLRGITATIPGIVFQLYVRDNGDIGLYYLSEKAEEILGMTHENEYELEAFFSRVNPEDMEQFHADLQQAVAAHSGWKFAGRFLHPDGRTLWLEAMATPVLQAGETIFNGIMLDVTDLVLARKDLLENDATLKAVLNTIPVRVFWKDLDLNLLGCNLAFAHDAGFSTIAEALGRSDYEMGWRDQAELYRADDRKVISSGQALVAFEEPQTTPTGQKIWLRTSKAPLKNASGETIGVLGTYEDITETKRMEEQLAKAEKMQALGLLAGGVAHDLNNTLAPLVGYPELMLRQLPPGSPLIKLVERIKRAALDATEVVHDLLTMARRGRYEMKPTSLNQVVTDYLDSPHFLRISTEKPEISVATTLNQDLPTINGSAVHLSKVIMNVVGNAFDAMASGGKITISTKLIELNRLLNGFTEIAPGTYAVLSIQDTGCGIAPEDIQKIFEPYFSRKSMGKSGTGLGLAVVYGVVKDHQGYYDLISEVGKGTEFIFYFPIPTSNQTAANTLATERTQRSVLVVDDSAETREMAKRMLATFGYSVDTVATGHEAINYLQSRPVDLVLLDMVMEPGFDGLDTFQELLKIRPHQLTAIVSGYSDTERVQKMLALGAKAFIRKPYAMETLEQLLADLFEKQA